MKKFLSVALALAMTLSLVVVGASAKSFTDNSKIKYNKAVDVVSAVKIVDGYTDGSFNPTNTLTRGAAAKIICNMMLGPTTASALGVSTAPFKDVSTSNVFAGYIAYCAKQGIINGYADKTFRPAGTVNGFQFLKMLLGALGYDGSIEGFTGANWEVSVAKLASNLKLFNGNSAFNGNKAMTREEACLYAYNTLTATMVEYETKGSTIVVNGVTISQGASKAKPIARTTGTNYTGAAETSTGTLQFCEQYFPKLAKRTGTDAFYHDTTIWKNGTDTIGTYAASGDETYTAATAVGKMYTDLGLSKDIPAANITLYVDGVANTADVKAVTKGGTATYGGNGTKTDISYDADANTLTVVEVNTYVGKITGTYAASSTRDAYVTFEAKTGAGSTFETNDTYAIGDMVLYTYSSKAGDTGVQSMAKAKAVTGTLTAYTDGANITVGGTKYDANFKGTTSINTTLSNAMKTDVTVYLDSYGYAAYVDASAASDNYAVVLGYTNAASAGSMGSRSVNLMLADGTTKTVTAASTSDEFEALATSAANQIGVGEVVSYSLTSDGNYKLQLLANADSLSSVALIVKGNTKLANEGSIGYNTTEGEVYVNGNTKFLFKNGSTYSVYTGIANVPSVTLGSIAAKVSVYVKPTTATTKYAALVYVDVTSATVTNTSRDVMFIKGDSNIGMTYNTDGNYYQYDAVVNGNTTTVKTDNPVNAYVLVSGLGQDSKGVYNYDAAKAAYAATNGSPVMPSSNTTSDGVFYCNNGNDKAVNGSITLGGNVYSYSTSDCKVFVVSADGKTITPSTVGAIVADTNDLIWYKLTSGEVTTIVIRTVDATTTPVTPPVDNSVKIVKSDADNHYANPLFYTSEAGVTLTQAKMEDALFATMKADGCTNIKLDATKLTYTNKNGIEITTDAVSFKQAYKVSGALDLATAAKITGGTTDTYTYATVVTDSKTGVKVDGAWYVTNGATLTITFKNAVKTTAATKDSIAITAVNSTVTTSPVDYVKDTAAGTPKAVTLTAFTGDVTVALTGSTTT